MEFKVKFTTKSYGAPAYMSEQRGGLSFLDRVRHEVGVPNLAPSLVSDRVHPKEFRPIINLTEEQARESGLYEETPTVRVFVPPRSLNRFVKVILGVNKDPETGAITHVEGQYELEEKALLDAWVKAGYPTEWDPQADEAEAEEA